MIAEASDISPFTAILWCFYPVAFVVGLELFLRASGDAQYIDSYAIFKKTRKTVSENISVNNGDECTSFGPISIDTGTTVTINTGGEWAIY